MRKFNLFNQVKVETPTRSFFDLSYDHKLSLDMGYLVPACCMEAMPGDKFNISSEALLRFAPLIAPVMHRLDMTMHYFFVPNRILWKNWDNFYSNTKIGSPTPSLPPPPYLELSNLYANAPLCDYLGIPSYGGPGNLKVSALPFAAYQKVYDEYYRDQNLISKLFNESFPTLVDGNNAAKLDMLVTLRKRAWEHDYFTGSLPFAQKGDAVDIPLSFVDVPVKRSIDPVVAGAAISNINVANTPGAPTTQAENEISPEFPTTDQLYADTSELAGGGTINDFRLALTLQKWYEKLARGGSRITEFLRTMFGVRSSDARLQRPEYITGVQSPVQISEVVNTTGTVDAPQGNMAGHGVSALSGNYGQFHCEEAGFIIGVFSVRPKTAYQQGLHKMFSRLTDPTEYPFPTFSNIGEQEVKNKEIYMQGTAADDETFGYVPRYAEMKYMPSRVSGDFKTDLAFWHFGRIFTALPALNQAFVECTPREDPFAVVGPEVPHKLYAHILNKVTVMRALSKYGTPTL